MVRLLVALLAALVPVSASGAAWTLKQGETRTYTTSTFTYGDHGFDDDGNLVKVPEYRKFTLNGALEYGIRPWLTAVVRGELRDEYGYGEISRLPYASPIFVEGRTNTTIVYGYRSKSYANVLGGARARLLNRDFYVVSLEAVASTGGFDSGGDGAPSDGPFVEARAQVGASRTVAGRNVFGNAELGYRVRIDKDDKDEIVLDLTIGAQVHPRLMLIGQTFSTFEVDGDVHYTKAAASVVYHVNERFRLEVGALGTVHGRNAIQEIGAKVGFWWLY